MMVLTLLHPHREYIRSAHNIPVDEAARECARRTYGKGAEPTALTTQTYMTGKSMYTYQCRRPSPCDPTLFMYVGDVTFEILE